MEEMTVIGDARDPGLKPESLLEGNELRRRLGSTLGATLEQELGVHNATFGPGVGLPVIRGMSGPRVKVLQSSISSHDASSVSPDHAVTIEPLLAEEIEVYKGPSALRYSGSAMGGAVDVKDGRIPESVPAEKVTGAIESRYDSNPDYLANVFKIDAGAGPVAVHLDGYHRDGNNISIPDNALDEAAVLEQFGDLVEFENTQGEVVNTDSRAYGFTAGASLVFEQGFIGIAANRLDSNYGIPPGGVPPHSDDPANPIPTPENLRIDMEQSRWDVAAQLNAPLPFIEAITLRASDVDYEHFELARDLPVTRFTNQAREGRAEAKHRFHEAWHGTVGYQWTAQTFGATGVESFIPTSDIDRRAAYLIQEFGVDRLTLEAAMRREVSEIEPVDNLRFVGGVPIELPAGFEFTAHSTALAATLEITPALSARLGFTRAERTPAVQEVLSVGPHLATRSFSIGNTNLEVEHAGNVDAALQYRGARFDFTLSVYRNQVNDYIYQENLGVVYDIDSGIFKAACVSITLCVPVYGYFQQDAEFLGYEAQLRYRPPEAFGISSEVEVFSDYVRGYFIEDGEGDVPRLPPRRLGVGVALERQSLSLEARYVRGFNQGRPGNNETPTRGFNRLDMELSYLGSAVLGEEALVFVKGKNLLDEEIRHSTSFLRSFAPEPGRSIEAGIRWVF